MRQKPDQCSVPQNEEGLYLFLYSVFLMHRRELWDADLEGGAWDVFLSPLHSEDVVAPLL